MNFKYWEERALAEEGLKLQTGSDSAGDGLKPLAEDVSAEESLKSHSESGCAVDELTPQPDSEFSAETAELPKDITGTPENVTSVADAAENAASVTEAAEKDISDAEAAAAENATPGSLSTGRILRCIFLDGLLGIPALTVGYLIISAFVAAFAVLAVIFLLGAAALLLAALGALTFGLINIISQTDMSLICIGSAFIGLAAAALFLMLAALTGLRLVPAVAGLCGRLEAKLNLFH